MNYIESIQELYLLEIDLQKRSHAVRLANPDSFPPDHTTFFTWLRSIWLELALVETPFKLMDYLEQLDTVRERHLDQDGSKLWADDMLSIVNKIFDDNSTLSQRLVKALLIYTENNVWLAAQMFKRLEVVMQVIQKYLTDSPY